MRMGVRVELPVARLKSETNEARERAIRAALEALAEQRRRLAADLSGDRTDPDDRTEQQQRS